MRSPARRRRFRATARALRRAPAGPSAPRDRAARPRRVPEPPSTTFAASRTARSRSSSAARTASTPSAFSASHAASRRSRSGDGGPGGDRDRRRGASPARARAARRPGWLLRGESRRPLSATGIRTWETRARSGRRPRRRVLRAPPWPNGSRAPRRPSRAAVRVRARRRADPWPLDVLWQEGDRALVVDYKSNALDGRAGRDHGRRIRSPEARLRARLPAQRRNGRRGRIPVPRTPDAVARRPSRSLTWSARRRALRRDRPDPRRRLPADAERVRVRGLPCARPRVRRAATSAYAR